MGKRCIKGLLNIYSSVTGIRTIIKSELEYLIALMAFRVNSVLVLLVLGVCEFVQCCGVTLLFLIKHKVWQPKVLLACRVRVGSLRKPHSSLVARSGKMLRRNCDNSIVCLRAELCLMSYMFHCVIRVSSITFCYCSKTYIAWYSSAHARTDTYTLYMYACY